MTDQTQRNGTVRRVPQRDMRQPVGAPDRSRADEARWDHDLVQPVEITDLLWSTDVNEPHAGVRQADVVDSLNARGQSRAARIVSRMPTVNGFLDPSAVDATGLRVHRELQRLSEELQFGRRVAALLKPLVAQLQGTASTVRILDVGCGLGYVMRWVAATKALGTGVELVGFDLNQTLVTEAARLADLERLDCRFIQGDAFAPGVGVEDGSRTIIISSGLMHHLAPPDLPEFFAAQQRLEVAAFAHWDIAPCRWSTIGAWIFHQARMREPISRHDGVLSARRAHPASVLLAAANQGASAYRTYVDEGPRWQPRALDVLRPIVGTHTR